MCDEFHPYRSISFHVIRSNRRGNKNYFFASFFIGTCERKDLQQPEPQRSVSALTAQHCSLLCPVISCLMWLGCPLATFSVELLQTHEPLLTLAGTGHFASFHGTGGGGWYDPPLAVSPLIELELRGKNERVARRETKRLIYKL